MNDESWGGIQGILEHVAEQAKEPLHPHIDNLAKTVVANIASNTQRAKQPVLLAKDGATFHAYIRAVQGNQFVVACNAQLEKGSSWSGEAPYYAVFNSKHEAQEWVYVQAANRDFEQVFWSDEFSASVD